MIILQQPCLCLRRLSWPPCYDHFVMTTLLWLPHYGHLPTMPLFQRIVMTNLFCLCSSTSVTLFICLINPPFGKPYSWSIKTPILPMLNADLLNSTFRERQLALINMAMIWVRGFSPHVHGINIRRPHNKIKTTTQIQKLDPSLQPFRTKELLPRQLEHIPRPQGTPSVWWTSWANGYIKRKQQAPIYRGLLWLMSTSG